MHVQSIISAQDAFAALMQGKAVLARLNFTGNSDEDFAPISDYPADIFAKPHVEYCIQIETIMVNGYEFTKPLTIDEIQIGQDVYIVNTYGPSIYVAEFTEGSAPALIEAIHNGFAQRDEENAWLQLQAIALSFGRDINGVCSVVRIGGDQPKSKRTRKAKEEKAAEEVKSDAPAVDLEPNITPVVNQEPDNIYDLIEQAASVEYLEQVVAPKINEATGLLKDSALLSLKNLYAQRKEQLAQQNHSAIDSLKSERLRIAQDLINRANEAKTVPEARALVGYTKNWPADERQSVIDAVNNRIVQIGEAHKPTLLDRAKYAKSLDELKQIESEFNEMDSSHAMYFSIGKAIRDRRVDLGDINAL